MPSTPVSPSDPAISTVIPVRNGAKYLAAAIDSVLIQPDVGEILVIDDGSTDATPDVVAAFTDARVRYVRQDPLGAAAARNAGADLAQGALIAFLDADDLWLEGKIARQRAALLRGDGDMIFTLIEEFISTDLSPDERVLLRPHIGLMNGVSACTLLMRRTDFTRVGGFDERVRTGEFLDWYGRAQELGLRSHTLSELLVRRRLHGSNHGRSVDVARQHYASILHDMLVRRRATPTPGAP